MEFFFNALADTIFKWKRQCFGVIELGKVGKLYGKLLFTELHLDIDYFSR